MGDATLMITNGFKAVIFSFFFPCYESKKDPELARPRASNAAFYARIVDTLIEPQQKCAAADPRRPDASSRLSCLGPSQPGDRNPPHIFPVPLSQFGSRLVPSSNLSSTFVTCK